MLCRCAYQSEQVFVLVLLIFQFFALRSHTIYSELKYDINMQELIIAAQSNLYVSNSEAAIEHNFY